MTKKMYDWSDEDDEPSCSCGLWLGRNPGDFEMPQLISSILAFVFYASMIHWHNLYKGKAEKVVVQCSCCGPMDGLTWVGARDTCVSKKWNTLPLKLDKHGGGASLSFWSLWRSPPSKPIKIFKRGKFIKKPNEGRLFKLIKYQVRLTLMEAYFDQKLEVERQKIWDCAASLSNIERADISKPERFFERDISW